MFLQIDDKMLTWHILHQQRPIIFWCLSILFLCSILQQNFVATYNTQQHFSNSYQHLPQEPYQIQQPQYQEESLKRHTLYSNNNKEQQTNERLRMPSRSLKQSNDQSTTNYKKRPAVMVNNITESSQHKQRIWVPPDVIEKYPFAFTLQLDKKQNYAQIEICATDYRPIRWYGKVVCRPVCNNCRNGFCVAPGDCKCFENYVKSDNDDCVFTCPLGCLNGQCYLDGRCVCNPGYTLDETRKFCRPICSGDCGQNPKHNCTEPEVCSCRNDFQLTSNGCKPICDPDCGVGGYCVEHENENACKCEPGYRIKDKTCQSDCYQKCDNGICFSPNRCICKPGFSFHERSTICVPN
ncbi:neurogenic locus notch homolog protein 1 [Teleopsis dalmanni]|uniref:neurogenic locus notch homolog protein 1 n=1 Tax=Teleopsis dalmanni TaxID=139649 RepID=UPI0018CCE1E9|nr:neurogenic locus notch homolog protein 1 [Teleopsis dalmanni]